MMAAAEEARRRRLSLVSGFCWRYYNPMRETVRRIHDGLKQDTPTDIVDFLEENQKIPTRYEEKVRQGSLSENVATPLKARDRQFPALAPVALELPSIEVGHAQLKKYLADWTSKLKDRKELMGYREASQKQALIVNAEGSKQAAILAAEGCDLVFQLGDPELGRGVLTAPITGLLAQFEVLAPQLRDFRTQLRDFLAQMREPRWLGGRPVDFLHGLEQEVFHDPDD